MCPPNTSIMESREVNLPAPEFKKDDRQEEPKLETASDASSGGETIVAGNIEGKKSQENGSFQAMPSNIWNFGSATRKEKESRRTLACKLYEERHGNGDDTGEGMDRLWELYEDEWNEESSETESGRERGQTSDDEDDDEVEVSEETCCLEAFRLSAGKVNNLGLVRPNLVRISRAISGIRRLHQVATHSK
ncbi:uncharacterized protein LOC104416308 [Eucalyptus grandis]|uniref:uncharacterized protein LOC104416308 n=1 Tax=Eucalyptus grandis TaxID=71139 RepID=UPI0005265C6F|nr:uncharacterized protein LOC104416308 [Eucalyptus grandis]